MALFGPLQEALLGHGLTGPGYTDAALSFKRQGTSKTSSVPNPDADADADAGAGADADPESPERRGIIDWLMRMMTDENTVY